MLENVLRDAPIVPSLGEVMVGLWDGYMDAVTAALSHGWASEEKADDESSAIIRLVVDFNSWRVLTKCDLDDEGAARLAAAMVSRDRS